MSSNKGRPYLATVGKYQTGLEHRNLEMMKRLEYSVIASSALLLPRAAAPSPHTRFNPALLLLLYLLSG